MLCLRKNLECDRLSRGTTRPHTDAATALGVCIYTEFRDSRSVGPSLRTKVKISNEKCSLYTCLLFQFVEFSATLWFYPHIRGKVASLLSQRQGQMPHKAKRTSRRFALCAGTPSQVIMTDTPRDAGFIFKGFSMSSSRHALFNRQSTQ